MNYKILIFLATWGMICSSCLQGREEHGEKYEVLVMYKDATNRHKRDWVERQVDQNRLYVFFEVHYLADTISIKTNVDKNTKTVYLTTSPQNAFADYVEFDDKEKIEWIEVRKNSGKALKIYIKEKWMNKWAINYFNDTLRAYPLTFAPFYD